MSIFPFEWSTKLILILFFIICTILGIKHYNSLNKKVGSLETSLKQKQDLIDTQNKNFKELKEQVNKQAKAISDLQHIQDELEQQSAQRKITIKEIFNHDQEAKTWASQPVPNDIRSLFNTTKSTGLN